MTRLLCFIFGCNERGARMLLGVRPNIFGQVIEFTDRGARIKSLEFVPQAFNREIQV